MAKDIFEMLNKYGIDCTTYRGCLEDYDKIVNEVAKVVTSRVGDE